MEAHKRRDSTGPQACKRKFRENVGDLFDGRDKLVGNSTRKNKCLLFLAKFQFLI